MTRLLWSLWIILVPVSFCLAQQEERMTITTYYPSPNGSYHELRVDQVSVGSGYRTAVIPAESLIVEGNVGIGTPSPGAKLEIQGSIKIVDGNQAAARVLTSDASGNGTWRDMSHEVTVVDGDIVSGAGDQYSYAWCPAGYVLTGCSGWYNAYCWGSWACEYLGTYPLGNQGCVAIAHMTGNVAGEQLQAYAHCIKTTHQ